MSPRVFRLVALPAPSDREKTQMYLQRYIAHLPAAGEIAATTSDARGSTPSRGAVDAAKQGLIRPLLVGSRARIGAVAEQLGVDLGGPQLVEAPHSHAAAARAVQLVIVLGAKVPIILTSRADSVMAGLAFCAVASLVAEARRRSAGKAVAG